MINKLLKYPHVFNFFQAVRLLESLGDLHYDEVVEQVGFQHKKVRFRASNALCFPSSEIESIKINKLNSAVEMFVSFLGVNGPSGVLPTYYTELLAQRLHQRDTTLQDFFAIFNHRAIYLFYRAWAKYRIYANPRAISNLLACKIGIGSKSLQNRMTVPDETLLFYSGLLQQSRSASALQSMLSDYFAMSIKIAEFQGEWLYLRNSERTYIGVSGGASSKSTYNILGINCVLGQKIWHLQNRFRICIGPVSYLDYQELLPIGRMLQALHELVRFYVGIELSFDVKIILRAPQVPRCRLGSLQNPFYLGWNTWLKGKEFIVDAGDLVLRATS